MVAADLGKSQWTKFWRNKKFLTEGNWTHKSENKSSDDDGGKWTQNKKVYNSKVLLMLVLEKGGEAMHLKAGENQK